MRRFIRSCGRFDNATCATIFLVLLVAADLVYILLHILLKLVPVIDNPLYSLQWDRGYAETYQYMKEFWIVILLIMFAIKTRTIGFIVWILLFLYLLFDDAMMIHERLGRILAVSPQLEIFSKHFAKDLGELLVSATVGGIFCVLFGWLYFYGSIIFRQLSKHLFLLLCALAFFGIFVDTLHIVVHSHTMIPGLVEDGGEMVMMSFIVRYAFMLNVSKIELPADMEECKSQGIEKVAD